MTTFLQDLRQCIDDGDFTTALDDQGKAVLLAIQEDKRKRSGFMACVCGCYVDTTDPTLP